MSIKGLWKILKRFVRDGHLSQFRGQRVAVDMYVWLHRAIMGSVTINPDALLPYLHAKLVRGDAEATVALEDVLVVTDQYIVSVMEKVHHLQRFGIVPVCVFDGTEMPMKQGTDEDRQARREAAFQKAMRCFEDAYSVEHATLRSPSHSLSEGIRELEKAVDISTEMAHTVIQLLQEERHVECLVAPYEADAQLSYLCREGYVQAVLSEDSDLIAYFCPCVISKLDKTGRCDVVKPPEVIPVFFAELTAQLRSRRTTTSTATAATSIAGSSTSSPHSAAPPSPSFSSPTLSAPATTAGGFKYESFLLGCVLSGCDYVRSLHGIGVAKAFRLVCQAQSLSQLMHLLRDEYGFPKDELQRYRHQVLSAFYCFAHHIVYCPRLKRLTLFHPLPELPMNGAKPPLKTDLVGKLWPDEVARKVCEECLYDPCTQRLYCGTYQPCVEQYVKRTRHGQVSLTSFTAFQALSSAKVVVRKRGRDSHEDRVGATRQTPKAEPGTSDEDDSGADAAGAFSHPLRRVQRVSGFLGSLPTALTTASSSTVSAGSLHVASQPPTVPSRALVRSKYFLQQTAVIDAGSSSDDDDDDDDEARRMTSEVDACVAMTAATTTAVHTEAVVDTSAMLSVPAAAGETTTSSSEGARDSYSPWHTRSVTQTTATTTRTADSPLTSDLSLVGRASTSNSLTRVDTSANTQTAPAVAIPDPVGTVRCACPFGYWQCHSAHSIFVQCFQGKNWTRGELPATTTTTSTGTTATTTITRAPSHSDDNRDDDVTDDEQEDEEDKTEKLGKVPKTTLAPRLVTTPLSPSSLHVVGAFRAPRSLASRPSAADMASTETSRDGLPIRTRDENAAPLKSSRMCGAQPLLSSTLSAHDLDESVESGLSHASRGADSDQTADEAHAAPSLPAARKPAGKDATSLFERLTFSHQ